MKTAVAFCVLLAVASAWNFRPHSKPADSQPLQITVFTESLCGDCVAFILGSYSSAIKADGLEKIANVTIIPFGNAKEQQVGDKYQFTCQHGTKECLGNAIENCLFAHVEQKSSQKVLVCLESKVQYGDSWENVIPACANETGTDLSALLTCANSDEGMMLTHQAAQRTDPNHKYVPWVVVNGQHSISVEDQILDNIVRYACSQYSGDPLPICQNYTLLSESHIVTDDSPLQIVAAVSSLEPYSMEFMITSFADAYNTKDIEKIANLTLIPYGMTKEELKDGHYVYTCKYGEEECLGNSLLNCVLNKHDKETAYKAILCMKRKRFNQLRNWPAVIEACTNETGLDLSSALTCANSSEGEGYTHAAHLMTDTNITFTPWITVNGVYESVASGFIYLDALNYICKNYKGSIQIDACKNVTKLMHRCYQEEDIELFDI
eukprot:CAMPEP_0176412472 /NCGR_PEP_ID=MMETSP0127-20121128/4161_1 /TAXON_ID=938130 /ORGANISM="Platyophrya macrostoma, Strain WH" /LENGTH=434 /DNA_ID=CAMNT_0017792143 /DNA_START=21 /DNA_END=1325 /DNA_ORIENTATION=+